MDDDATQELRTQIHLILDLAKRVFALGWGLDLAAGHAVLIEAEQTPRPAGERWIPVRPEHGGLRVPNAGTLKELKRRHRGFVNRVSGSRLNAIPNISPAAYRQIAYQCDSRPSQSHVAVFQFLRIDKDHFRSFPTLRACAVAGMLRHAAANAAEHSGWNQDRINKFILGHAEGRNQDHVPVGMMRFAYLPLPSLEFRPGGARVIGPIRRAMLHIPGANTPENLDWANRVLDGRELIAVENRESQAVVSRISEKDRNVQPYLQPAHVWESVTPMIMPGRDDRKQKKAERLIRKAILKAGFSETLAEHAELDWRKACFWPGGEIANRTFLPDHLRNFPRYHCQIRWKDAQGTHLKIPGPIAIGGGRYAGLGLFASPDSFQPT